MADVRRARAQGGRRVYTADRRRSRSKRSSLRSQVANRVRRGPPRSGSAIPSCSTLRRASAGVGVDQHRGVRAARDRLDRERPGAAEEVEDARSETSPRIEKSVSRTRSEVGRTSREPSAGGAACARPALPATILMPRFPSSARRRSGRGRRPAAARARARRGRRGARSIASTSARAAASSSASSGSCGDAEARQAVLAGAEDLALAAQREVDLGELEAVALGRDRLDPPRRQLGLSDRRTGCSGTRARRAPPGRAAGAAARGRSARPPRSASRSRWRRRSRPRSRVVATSTSVSPAANALHRRRLLARRHLAVQQVDLGSRGTRPARSRSASSAAACACSFSDSSTSGQTT